MWAPYLKVIKKRAHRALNVLDYCHIIKKFSEVLDELHRQEVKRLKDHGEESILLQGRWLLLKKVAKMLRSHKAFILNWFQTGGEFLQE